MCSEENNNVITSTVVTSSIFMNQETPDERRGGLACVHYVDPVTGRGHF
jgi:hypothetical protein